MFFAEIRNIDDSLEILNYDNELEDGDLIKSQNVCSSYKRTIPYDCKRCQLKLSLERTTLKCLKGLPFEICSLYQF